MAVSALTSPPSSSTLSMISSFARMVGVASMAAILVASAMTMCATGTVAQPQLRQLRSSPFFRQVQCPGSEDHGYISIADLNADMVDLHAHDFHGSGEHSFSLCPGSILEGNAGPIRPLYSVHCHAEDCVVKGGNLQVEIASPMARSVSLSGITFLESTDVSVAVVSSNTDNQHMRNTLRFQNCHWKSNTGRASILITTAGDSGATKHQTVLKVRDSSITHGYSSQDGSNIYRPIFSAHGNISMENVTIAYNTGGFVKQEEQQRPLPSSFALNLVGGTTSIERSHIHDNAHFTALIRPTRGARLAITETVFENNHHGMGAVVALGGSHVELKQNCQFSNNLVATADVMALQGSTIAMEDVTISYTSTVVAPVVADDTATLETKRVVAKPHEPHGIPSCSGTLVVHDENVGQCLYGGTNTSNCFGTCESFDVAKTEESI